MGDEIEKTDTTSEDTGSEKTPDTKGSETAAEIASYKKRQAGAEAARQIAEAKAAEFEKELAKYRSADQTKAEKELGELASTKARLEVAEKKAADAEADANKRILDYRFPKARAKLPELTDEARLAEFEVLLSDDAGNEPPTPIAHNESRSPSGKGTPAKEETAAEVRARLESMPLPEGW